MPIHAMSQDTSRQTYLTEESLKVWQQLMRMGFDDNIALDALKKNAANIEKCINYILKQKAQEEIKTNEKQTYKERIDNVLRLIEPQRQLQAQDIYGFIVEKEYANNNGINGFIADCGEYALNIDSIYADNVKKCRMEGCA
eukprot:960614_1